LGGGQIGFDYQLHPNWVVGIEGQFSGTSLDRSFMQPPAGGRYVTAKTDWLASVTGRLGYTWGPGLIYAKAGVAFQNDDPAIYFANRGNPVTTLSSDRNSTGYTVGGGFEYMFTPAWSAKVEYQYYNFGRSSLTGSGPGPLVSYRDDVHTVKVGVNYRFNWNGPVVAKY
jgi:outer membrane immunogenic protein